jgi:2-polyprenyl-3-methyl-5-hydroxy-6-metoxy-1,4-benzoquinol methylase
VPQPDVSGQEITRLRHCHVEGAGKVHMKVADAPERDATRHHPLPRLLEERTTFLLERCRARRVLHLGCLDWPIQRERLANGTWLHGKLTEVAAELVGIDLAADAILEVQSQGYGHNIHRGDAEHLDEVASRFGRFDVVVAGELIEHLNNPGLFLESAKAVLSPDGRLLITTPNAFCLRRFLRVPFGSESVHRDHVSYYSHATLSTLAQRFGYETVHRASYRMPGTRPFLAATAERVGVLISPNLGEGLLYELRLRS